MGTERVSIEPVQQRNWDWRAAGNFVGGGSGSGLLIIIAVLTLLGARVSNLIVIAVFLIVTGLGLVWLEIGRPWRFLNVYRNPATSWMSRESWLASVLVPLALLASWFESNTLIILTGLNAALFLYSQGRILKAARSIAAWRIPEVVPLVMTTGLTEGIGILLISWVLIPDLKANIGLFDITIISVFLILARIWMWIAYREALFVSVPDNTREIILRSQLPFILYGHILPIALLFIAVSLKSYVNILVLLSGLCIMLSGWNIKFIIITRAALNQGYALPHSPARGGGKSGPGVKPGWTSK
jgi:phenylacetyl-CoA:acceptor oxidoreductase 26-kDa subunit